MGKKRTEIRQDSEGCADQYLIIFPIRLMPLFIIVETAGNIKNEVFRRFDLQGSLFSTTFVNNYYRT